MELEPRVTRSELERLATYLEPLIRLREDADAFEYALIDFLDDVYASGFMVPYDWPAHAAVRGQELKEPNVILTMDMDTFRRTVISHIRADRFVEGHLRELARNGCLTAVVQRAHQLAAAL